MTNAWNILLLQWHFTRNPVSDKTYNVSDEFEILRNQNFGSTFAIFNTKNCGAIEKKNNNKKNRQINAYSNTTSLNNLSKNKKVQQILVVFLRFMVFCGLWTKNKNNIKNWRENSFLYEEAKLNKNALT